MIKIQHSIIFIFLTSSATYINSIATQEILKRPEDGGTCVAQLFSASWGASTHAPITIIQNSAIDDISKILHPTKLFSKLHAHWGKIALGTIFVSYIWVLYQIRFTCLLIKQHNAWCNWKAVVPLHHLQISLREDLLVQLKFDIGKKYATQNLGYARYDVSTFFIQDIHTELENLNTYLKWYEIAHKIYCTRFFNFPFDIQNIEEKKARLHFILDLFMTSQAEKL